MDGCQFVFRQWDPLFDTFTNIVIVFVGFALYKGTTDLEREKKYEYFDDARQIETMEVVCKKYQFRKDLFEIVLSNKNIMILEEHRRGDKGMFLNYTGFLKSIEKDTIHCILDGKIRDIGKLSKKEAKIWINSKFKEIEVKIKMILETHKKINESRNVIINKVETTSKLKQKTAEMDAICIDLTRKIVECEGIITFIKKSRINADIEIKRLHENFTNQGFTICKIDTLIERLNAKQKEATALKYESRSRILINRMVLVVIITLVTIMLMRN